MKNLIFLLLVSVLCSYQYTFAQKAREIPKDSTVNFRNILWEIEKDEIYKYKPDWNHDYFFELFIIKVSEGESNLEGECYDQLFLLKGEYGEYPDGKLYDLGWWYHARNIKFEGKELHFTHGKDRNLKSEIISLSNL